MIDRLLVALSTRHAVGKVGHWHVAMNQITVLLNEVLKQQQYYVHIVLAAMKVLSCCYIIDTDHGA